MEGNVRIDKDKYHEGLTLMSNSSVSICSIVRDCGRNLKRNIPKVESLRELFRDSEVVVFENDSKDETLDILRNWHLSSFNVHVFSEKYQVETIPMRSSGQANPFFSVFRIEKMARYRNKYLEYINSNGFERDFVIVIDLDISGFEIDGLVNSFGTPIEWDCITANGKSLSSSFKSQYHDSYALIEYQKTNSIQTENSIKANRKRLSSLKQGMPLVLVDSAFGGMAVYRWGSIRDTYYSCLINEDQRVQCKSEHVGLHKSMAEHGFSRIYLNPSMKVKYRSVSPDFLVSKLANRLFRKTV